MQSPFVNTFSSSRLAQGLDTALYSLACTVLAVTLLLSPPTSHAGLWAWVLGGLLLWSLLEYLLHRFVLHGVQPFKGWHAQHHRCPHALAGAPTWMSLGLFALLLGAPMLWWTDAWRSAALMLGVLGGYLGYSLLHQALHRVSRQRLALDRRGRSPRLLSWRRQHALHHRAGPNGRCYGVSTSLWDRVFGSQGAVD